MIKPWTLDTLPTDHIVTVMLLISGDDIATLKRSQTRAVGHDDAKMTADLLRRLGLALEDRARKLQKDTP